MNSSNESEALLEQVKKLYAHGYYADEIAKQLGLERTLVAQLARKHKLKRVKGVDGYNGNRVIAETIKGIGYCMNSARDVLEPHPGIFATIDRTQVPRWIAELEKYREHIAKLIAKLKELLPQEANSSKQDWRVGVAAVMDLQEHVARRAMEMLESALPWLPEEELEWARKRYEFWRYEAAQISSRIGDILGYEPVPEPTYQDEMEYDRLRELCDKDAAHLQWLKSLRDKRNGENRAEPTTETASADNETSKHLREFKEAIKQPDTYPVMSYAAVRAGLKLNEKQTTDLLQEGALMKVEKRRMITTASVIAYKNKLST